MYSINDIKKDMLIEIDGVPHKIVSAEHNFVGRTGATLRTRLKNLLTGNMAEKTFRPADKISPANLSIRPAQYLYREGSSFVFMEPKTFEQTKVEAAILADKGAFLAEGQSLTLVFSGQRILDVALPNSVSLTAAECEPGVKGDTATAAQKVCLLETGLKVNVPLFIKEGDLLKIDTRTGRYLERVSKPS